MNEQRDWHDLKLQQLQDDNSRLRAELAAEKERCAKIADVIAEEGKLTTCYWRLRKVAAAIRASNTAPPQPCSYPQYCGREVCNCPRDAAPSHVEPSAAESERWVSVPAVPTDGMVETAAAWEYRSGVSKDSIRNIYAAMLACAKSNHAPAATEARMLELAREIQSAKWLEAYPRARREWELAALVIAFGEKK